MVQEDSMRKDELITVPVDRNNDNTYPQNFTIDALPTLTTHNRYLFVISVRDVIVESCLNQCYKVALDLV